MERYQIDMVIDYLEEFIREIVNSNQSVGNRLAIEKKRNTLASYLIEILEIEEE